MPAYDVRVIQKPGGRRPLLAKGLQISLCSDPRSEGTRGEVRRGPTGQASNSEGRSPGKGATINLRPERSRYNPNMPQSLATILVHASSAQRTGHRG